MGFQEMRSRWDFFFECIGILFERTHTFEAKLPQELAESFGLPPQEINALIMIEPDEEVYPPPSKQTGQLKVTLPGNKEQTKSLAFWLAGHAAQQIAPSRGEMKIVYRSITGELLPDTPEEAEQLGDALFFSEADLVGE